MSDKIPNRFLRTTDLNENPYKDLKKEFDQYYKNYWRGLPHKAGAKNPSSIITQWSREWEYPWAVVNSEVKSHYKILDCGCGGSPLLPFIAEKTGCKAIGIDLNYGNKIRIRIDTKKPLADLRNFYINPSIYTSNKFSMFKGNIENIPFDSNYFDRVFCISVIEHIESEKIGKNCINEMVRVLKQGGKLLITMDHSQYKNHVKNWCLGQYKKIIGWSGLSLEGECDFTLPSEKEIHGYYHVVGFILKK